MYTKNTKCYKEREIIQGGFFMNGNDIWCDFCNDKPKTAVVTVRGKKYEVCGHCESLTVQDEKKGDFSCQQSKL